MSFSFLNPFQRKKEPSSEVFFVRGFNRSGTNWVANLLSQHPDISINGEFHLQQLDTQVNIFLKQSQWNFFLKKPESKSKFISLYHEFIKDTIRLYNKKTLKVGDRTPSRIDQLIIPNSKYIIISRDGRDAIVSWFYHILNTKVPDVNTHEILKRNLVNFESNPNYFENQPTALLNCEPYFRQRAKYWNNQIVRDKIICNKVDKRELDIKYLWITYEELHIHTDENRNSMFDFLCVDPNKSEPLDSKTSPGFANHNPKSHYRLGATNNWHKYFTPQYAKWFDEEAGEALRLLDLPLTSDLIKESVNSK